MFTIGQVLDRYSRVIFDTSVLQAERSIDDLYRPEITSALKSDRFSTVRDVVFETWNWLRHYPDPTLLERVESHEEDIRNVKVMYKGFFNHLVLSAKRMHIVDHTKPRPYTDVKLAALAMTFACESEIAFISSDRRLNELVESERKNPSLPTRIHQIDVYSFVKHDALYIPYVEEKATHGGNHFFKKSLTR